LLLGEILQILVFEGIGHMKLAEAKQEFIQAWGTLGSKWGVNRTMAQVHSLLLITPNSISADEVMEELNISRGNANMNLRALIDWGLIKKELKPGERREFFYAEKDIWKVARQIMRERKRRELDPLQQILNELKNVEQDTEEAKAFYEMVNELSSFTNRANQTLDTLMSSEENWFLNSFMKLMKAKG